MIKTYTRTFTVLMTGLMLLSASLVGAQDARPEGWVEESHGNDAALNYDVVFPDDAVNSLTITISPENWAAMLDDMTGLYGEFGAQAGMAGRFPGGDFQPPAGFDPEQLPEGFQPPAGFDPSQLPEGFDPRQMLQGGDPPAGFQPPPGLMGGPLGGVTENPMWVTTTVEFNGDVWTNVGMRFKGNSSLVSTWSGGVYKLPFKLDFDQFEDDYPEIHNQRFYGFQQVSFSSNWSDDSLLRERVTADIFREAGVPAAQTAFYAVYVDYGAGPVYFGLYTAVEVVDDTVIETQFADDGGNLYKPEGTGATFAAGTFDEASFEKETNEDEADYSDILELFDALHAETRTTDPAAWRTNLEVVFDVDGFMHWLAVNSVVQNWDTYGTMSHNYYLYHDPTTDLLTWIPWDNNMALSEGMGGMFQRMQGGRPTAATTTSSTTSISLENVNESWPLIRYLMDDPEYQALYVGYVEDTINGAFAPAQMEATYRELHDLIAPYVVGENGEIEGYTLLSSPAAFDTALTTLIEHVNDRYALAQEYLVSQ